MQLLVTFSSFPPVRARGYGTPRFMCEFGDAFLRVGKSCPNWGRGSFSPRSRQKKAKDSDVNIYTNRLLELRSEKLPAPSFHGCAHHVSGPGLRTAPALPIPWIPNPHTPASRPSITAQPSNHNASAASTSQSTLDRIRWAGGGRH